MHINKLLSRKILVIPNGYQAMEEICTNGTPCIYMQHMIHVSDICMLYHCRSLQIPNMKCNKLLVIQDSQIRCFLHTWRLDIL